MNKIKIYILIIFVSISYVAIPQSIVNTVHNLSTSGTGDIKATSESEICVFCHTPHNSRPVTPLWNRDDPGITYILYNSSTIDASPGQPDGASILCLSCHDGTIAIGNVYTRTVDISLVSGITLMPTGNSNLSTDLSDDHPISFTYNSALAISDGELKDPASITYPVELEDSKVQCTSCHDPHKNTYSKFLVTTSQNSAICLSCHDRDYWPASSHSTSTSTWNGSGTDPWTHTEYTTVSENACENCHRPHSAGSSELLMNYEIEENNCLNCHNGNVASTNIETQLSKSYTHNVYSYSGVHDAGESVLVLTQHVECADCHNPHAVRNNLPNAPDVQGYNEGVIGIDQSGNDVNPVSYEYEICYRCHADSPTKPASTTTRVIVQDNVRLEFDTGNPSYHPISGAGANTSVPSLISLTFSSIIYCTDCHGSDGAGSPEGPHGSIYPSILKYQYETADYTVESASSYELCYSCHSRTSILNDETFPYHYRHIVEENSPCNACHDPHGISSLDGTFTNNTHLINFDVNIVTGGMQRFVDQGDKHGYCQLNCHGQGHGFGMSY